MALIIYFLICVEYDEHIIIIPPPILSSPGNSSQVSDGAAAVILARRSAARRHNLPVFGVIRGFAVTGVPPRVMGVGPAYAIPAALRKAGI